MRRVDGLQAVKTVLYATHHRAGQRYLCPCCRTLRGPFTMTGSQKPAQPDQVLHDVPW